MKYYQNIFMVTSHYVIEYCSRFLDFSDREPANKLDFPENIKTKKKKKNLKLAIHSSETVIIKLKLQCNLSLSLSLQISHCRFSGKHSAEVWPLKNV